MEDYEQQLPEGLDPYFLSMVKIVQQPWRNIIRLPRALYILPMNAVISQSWKALMQIYSVLLLFALPAFITFFGVSLENDRAIFAGTSIFFILLGTIISPLYLKMSYQILNNMVESRKAPWLVEEVKPVFNEKYQTPWNRSPVLLGASFLLPLLFDIKVFLMLIQAGYSTGALVFNFIMLLIGHLGLTFMLYLAINAFTFVIINTGLYDMFLVKIIGRVEGYTEGLESIYTKKNYEVVKVLSDTPGLSIRSLGDIPQLGLLSSIVTFNAILFILIGPYIIKGSLANFLNSLPSSAKDPTNLTYLIVLGVFISALAAFGAVIMPLFRISNVMGRFKNKALMELDPYLFDEITTLTMKRDSEISNETLIMSMLRGYIYTMKISPVPPLRLVYLVLISLVYALRIIPLLINIFN